VGAEEEKKSAGGTTQKSSKLGEKHESKKREVVKNIGKLSGQNIPSSQESGNGHPLKKKNIRVRTTHEEKEK